MGLNVNKRGFLERIARALEKARDEGLIGGGGSVDSEMSDTSENPVQNKVIKEYVDQNAGGSKIVLLDTIDFAYGEDFQPGVDFSLYTLRQMWSETKRTSIDTMPPYLFYSIQRIDLRNGSNDSPVFGGLLVFDTGVSIILKSDAAVTVSGTASLVELNLYGYAEE